MNERLKARIKAKLRKQASIVNVARHAALPLAYGTASSLGQTPEGSRPSYYATDIAKHSLEGGVLFNKHIPTPLKIGAMVFNPLNNIPMLNRKDPLADAPYQTPSYEHTGTS